MATCANCGTENPDASKFCGNCGQALEAAAQPTETIDAASATTPQESVPPQEAAPTQQHAAYEAALAAINNPTTDAPAAAPTAQQPPVTTQVPPTGPATQQQPPAIDPRPQASIGEPVASAGPRPGGNKKVIAGIIIGSVAGLAILAAIYFLFLKNDDPEPAVSTGGAAIEETTGADPAEEVPAEEVPAGEAPAFDSIAPLVAESAGPYSLTQTSADPCEPPCIFPSVAHTGSTETMQVTYDAGNPESQIYGEFLLYGTVEDAQAAVAETAADLEARGYAPLDSFTIQGVTGTTYQSTEDEVLLWSSSNLMMGLVGNKGYPTELVGYLQ